MNKPPALSEEERIIYLFSSAPSDRPTYKRGVLNMLCYPRGHQLELSYKKSYLQPPLFEQRNALKNRKGVFVFVDYKAANNNDHEFIPIRLVKVVDVGPKETAKSYLDTTRVYVRIELGDLILSDPKYSDEIASIPGRPIPYQGSDATGTRRTYFYVIQGSSLFPEESDFSQRDIWNQITDKVAKAKSLSGCIFLATSHPRPFKDGGPCLLQPYGPEQKAYRLEPNNIYRVDLRVYHPQSVPTSNYDSEIFVRSSSELVAVSQPFATAHGGPEDHSVLIACKRTIESTVATLVVDVGVKALGQGSGQSSSVTDVVAAKPRYLLRIQPRGWIVRAFVILIFAGFF